MWSIVSMNLCKLVFGKDVNFICIIGIHVFYDQCNPSFGCYLSAIYMICVNA